MRVASLFARSVRLAAGLAAVSAFAQNPHAGLLKQYCQGCHNSKLKTANVSLDTLRVNAVGADAATWEKAYRKLRTGEMPPVGLPRPEKAVVESYVAWLDGELDRASREKPNPGAPLIHRLNRTEYGNAIRDLLALDIDAGADLPPDDGGFGFDNIGDALTVSPLLMEKYMSAARKVSRIALGTVVTKPAVERYNAPRGDDPPSDDFPVGSRGGVEVKRYFPVDAEWMIRARVRGAAPPDQPAPKLDVRVDGRRVQLFDVRVDVLEERQETRNYETRIPLKAGTRVIAATLLRESWKPEGGGMGVRRPGGPAAFGPSVEYVMIGGPFDVTGPGDTEARRRIFVCRPAAGDEAPCARQILSGLARRAYRRPVKEADVAPLMKLFAEGRADGGNFEAGIELALRGILVSPNFIYRVERAPAGSAPGTIHRLTDLELASRLSFLLWSAIPDEELLSAAERGKLRAAGELERQVRRMLADPKAEALVKNFAGQWLHLRNLPEWKPDPDKFPEFDDNLRKAAQRETELFFANLVSEDRSVLELLDADYTFLNERLARHYRIDGVRGNYFRRVALNNRERGGVLTHASILTVTSYPTRTSPVLRGKWILENLLGSPPPPPPPDVPSLDEKTAGSSTASVREQLERHRADAACAACHARLDPMGFALENYDAVGKFRDKEGGKDIDASAAMPGGAEFRGASELKKLLLDQHGLFVECMAEKLLTYALGRGLEHDDMPVVRRIARESAASGYRFSSLVLAVANSTPFQMRRTPER